MHRRIEPEVGQWWADNDKRCKSPHGVFYRVGQIEAFKIHPEKGRQACIFWRKGSPSCTWVSVKRMRPTSTGYVYLGDEEPPQGVSEAWVDAMREKETEFIVLFEDSQTWSSDDTEYITGNSFVIPQSVCTEDEWKQMMDQTVSIEEINPARISIPEMIRELKKAHRWDELVEEAKLRAEPSAD